MHELALVEEILGACQTAAASHRVQRVTAVHLTVGELAACPDALRFAWEACRGRFRLLETARLEIQEVPARWACPHCGGDYGEPLARCPQCGTGTPRLQEGLELRVDYLEGDDREGGRRGTIAGTQPCPSSGGSGGGSG
ncbi:MAG: hydrogenase maturation nickel metallochaperone HypA [Bacillota bacterium]|nr:hydrogenase maturation nickel metallochaperone HypA [Bacillota bacterium]